MESYFFSCPKNLKSLKKTKLLRFEIKNYSDNRCVCVLNSVHCILLVYQYKVNL